MRICHFARTMVLVSAACAALSAQEQPQFPGPEKEHQWLQQFVGTWESVSEGTTGPGQPPLTLKATLTSRMLGDYWIVTEMKGDVMGTKMQAIQTIGFDPVEKKYVGTWVDSMMHHLWKYEGWVDDTGQRLILEAEGPNFMAEGKIAKFRDAYEFKSADHIVVTSSMLGEDGQWITFMTGDSRRIGSTASSLPEE